MKFNVMEHVFVYGTLQRGFHNHSLLANAPYLGEAETLERFVLRARRGGIPFVGRDQAVTPIAGELFAVDAATLRRLDQLEGYDPSFPERSWYRRERIDVRCENVVYTAWIYFNSDKTEPVVPHGSFKRLCQTKQFNSK